MGGAVSDQALAGLPQDVQDGLTSLKKRTNALYFLPAIHIVLIWIVSSWGESLVSVGSRVTESQSKIISIVKALLPWLFMGEFLLITILLYIGFVIYAMWIYRANSNLIFMAVKAVKSSAADSVYWPIIPIAQFGMPYLAVREIWRGSDPSYPVGFNVEDAPASVAIKWWFITLYFSILFSTMVLTTTIGKSISGNMRGYEYAHFDAMSTFFMVLAVIVGALNYVFLLRSSEGIVHRQFERVKMVSKTSPNWLSTELRKVLSLIQGLDVVNRRKKQIRVVGLITVVVLGMESLYLLYGLEPVSSIPPDKFPAWANTTYMQVIMYGEPIHWISGISYCSLLLFAMWCYCAHRNLETLRIKGVKHTPLRAFLWWLIPGFNIVGMTWVLNEMWKGSDPDIETDGDLTTGEGTIIVPMAMAFFGIFTLMGVGLVFLIAGMDTNELTITWMKEAGRAYGIINKLISAAFIGCLIYLAIKITDRQNARAKIIHDNRVLPDEVFAKMQSDNKKSDEGPKPPEVKAPDTSNKNLGV